MTKPKPNTARQASRRAPALLVLMLPMPAPMDRPPRPGYAWDQYGNEVQLVRGRRWLRPVEREEGEHEH